MPGVIRSLSSVYSKLSTGKDRLGKEALRADRFWPVSQEFMSHSSGLKLQLGKK
jgi:hypothetical protein